MEIHKIVRYLLSLTLYYFILIIMKSEIINSQTVNRKINSKYLQSGMKTLYSTTSSIQMPKQQNQYTLIFQKTYTTAPRIFYLICEYRMGDRFVIQRFQTQVGNINLTNGVINAHPISSTRVLAFSISYLIIDNEIYGYINILDKTFQNKTQLISNSSSKNYNEIFNYKVQSNSLCCLSNQIANNKIMHSIVGFNHQGSTGDPTVDLYINPYFMNQTHYTINIISSSQNIWKLLMLKILIINTNIPKSFVQFSKQQIVLTDSDISIDISLRFSYFNNATFIIGMTGMFVSLQGIKYSITMYNDTYYNISIKNSTNIRNNIIFLSIAQTIPTDNNNSQGSSLVIGIIIGILIGVIVIVIIVIILYKYKFKKGIRVPMKENRIKQLNMFTPSFI